MTPIKITSDESISTCNLFIGPLHPHAKVGDALRKNK
jgi:hypothetical protein